MTERLLNVMVVEDDATLGGLYADELSKDPFIEATSVTTAEEAARRASREKQFVALIDPGLTDASGLEAFYLVSQRAPGAVIIIISGSEDMRRPCLEAGADGFILKGAAESFGDGLRKYVRDCVIARDHKRQFAPLLERNERIQKVLGKLKSNPPADE